MALKKKRSGYELAIEIRTFTAKDGTRILVIREPRRGGAGSFHAFQEVEAKAAARACGASDDGPSGKLASNEMWRKLWQHAGA